jgi:hypothetical protein
MLYQLVALSSVFKTSRDFEQEELPLKRITHTILKLSTFYIPYTQGMVIRVSGEKVYSQLKHDCQILATKAVGSVMIVLANL